MRTPYLITLFIFYSLICVSQKTTTGIISRVIDGDTYVVDASYKGHESTFRVRLANVDCPEIYFVQKKKPAQPFGDEAKSLVSQLIQGKSVSLTYYGKDNFGRVIAFITIDGERLDDIILLNGWGWAYKGYHPSKDYKHGMELMNKAKSFKQGLWIDPNPIPPSKWRSTTFNP